jgi:hypothetical protein
MKAFPNISMKPILDEITAAFCQFRTAPVRIESSPRLSPIEIRRYIRELRKYRQNGVW